MRNIGYMFVAAVVVSSVVTFATGFPRVLESRFWLYLHEDRVAIASPDPLLLAERPRHAYFFLGGRAFQGELTWDRISSRGSLFVEGDAAFISEKNTERRGAGGSGRRHVQGTQLDAGLQRR